MVIRGAGSLTEHGHVLACVEVPVAPVGPVAVQRGVLLMVVGGLCAEGVNHSDMAPEEGHTGRTGFRFHRHRGDHPAVSFCLRFCY